MNKRQDTVTISAFPNPFLGNPYLQLLYSNLKRAGVSYVKSGHFGQEWLRENRGLIDYVHFHWVGGFYEDASGKVSFLRLIVFLGKIWFARLLGYQIVWTAHNLYPHNRERNWKARIARFLFVNSVSLVFVNFPKGVDDIKKIFHRSKGVFVVPHGNYREIYPSIPDRALARSRLGLPEGAYIYLLFGGISPYKGAHCAIEAIQKLDDPNAVLVVLGQCLLPDYREKLRALAAQDCRVQLRIGDKDVPDSEVSVWMSAIDCVVAPYQDIYTSGMLHLATTFGKPIVVPQLGVFVEMQDDPFVYSYDPDRIAGELPLRMKEVRSADVDVVREAAFRFADAHEWSDIGRQAAEVLKACSHRRR